MITLKEAYQRHPLAKAVLNQLGGGVEAIQSAKEAGEHGADAGWPGFTYYSDTCAFTKGHRRAIAEAVEEMAEQLGEDPIRMVKGFNCLDKNTTTRAVAVALYGGRARNGDDEATQVENALAWFALEEVGRALEDD